MVLVFRLYFEWMMLVLVFIICMLLVLVWFLLFRLFWWVIVFLWI